MFDFAASTAAKVCIAILIICFLLNKRLVPKPLPGIPYNRLTRHLPLGDLITLGIHYLLSSSSFSWFAQQCLSHNSPIVQILVPSFSTTTPVILVADLYEVKDILLKRVHEIDRATLMQHWFGVVIPHGTIGRKTDGGFRRQRRLFGVLLSPGFVDEVAVTAFGEAVGKQIQLWGLKAEVMGGEEFAAYEDLRRTTLDAMWKILLSSDLGLNDASIAHVEAKRDVETANLGSASYPNFYRDFTWQLTALVWVLTGVSWQFYRWLFNLLPQFRTGQARTESLLEGKIIEMRTKIETCKPRPRCGLTEILQLQMQLQLNDRAAVSVADEAIRDEIMELLITGHETTASSTGWAMKYLADNQEIQEQLHQSLKAAFPDAIPDKLPPAHEICETNLPYLDAVLAEILRISATGPASFRETLVDTEIMGHSIPAHTPVFLVTQSTPDYVLTPDTFRTSKLSSSDEITSEYTQSFSSFLPSRWLRSDGTFNPDAGLSLPFSIGKRSCFGKKLAILELRLLIVMNVLSFRFEKLEERRSKYGSNDGLTRQPKCCFVLPVRREKS